MSHKNCGCNDCENGYWSDSKTYEEKPGDDKLLKKPIEIFKQPEVEAYWFLPEDCTITGFRTKDSGQRQTFSTGMQRDVQTDKPRYDLLDRDMLKRWAELMGRGALKYGEENWRKAETEEELKRFDASLLRHTFQLLEGDRTEDHGAAIMFNVSGREMVRAKLEGK